MKSINIVIFKKIDAALTTDFPLVGFRREWREICAPVLAGTHAVLRSILNENI